jgi:anti-sigma factor RsiW
MIALLRRWRCRAVAPLLVDMAENALSPASAARVERHLRDCADCRDALQALRTLPALLREEAAPVPRQSWERQRQDILRAVRNGGAREAPRAATVPGWQVVSAMTAVACVAAIAGVLLRDPAPRASEVALRARAAADEPQVVAALLELVPGDVPAWEGAGDVAAAELLADVPWPLAALDMADPPGWQDLRDQDVEDFDELVGTWLVS